METYTKEKAKQWLKMFPHWKAVACDRDGECFWYVEKPILSGECFRAKKLLKYGRVGDFTFDGDWKDTLVTRDDLVEYWGPKKGDKYFFIQGFAVRQYYWDGYGIDTIWLEANCIFRTEEAAKNALAEIKRRSREDRKIVS